MRQCERGHNVRGSNILKSKRPDGTYQERCRVCRLAHSIQRNIKQRDGLDVRRSQAERTLVNRIEDSLQMLKDAWSEVSVADHLEGWGELRFLD